jgi:hypothetical protein
MSVQHANRGIVKKDLQLYYNREFSKSFRGEATSNLANTVSIGAQGGSLTVATTYPSFSEDLSTGNYFKNFPNGGVLYHLVTNPAFSDNGSLYNNNGGLTGATSIPIAGTYLIFSFYVYLTQIYTGYAGGLAGYINVNTNSGGNGSIGSALTSYGWTFYVNGVADNGWSSNTANLNKWIRITAFVNNGAISSSAKYFSNWYIYNDRLTSGAMYIAKFQIEQKTYITNPVYYDILTNLSNRGETTTNLISNPDFTSTSNWTNNGNVTLSTLTVGAKTYLKVVSNQGSSTPGILSDAIAVTAGNVYTLSAYAYRSGAEAYLYVLNVTANSDLIWTGQSAAALGSTEGWCVNKFTVPSGCTSIKVGILFSGPTIGDTFYVEKMQLEQREYQSAFVNGSRTTNTLASGGGLLDMSGNNINADLTNVSFNSSGYFFNGSSNYIDLGSDVTFKTSGGWSVSSWFNLTQVNSGNLYNFIGASAITYNSWYWTVYQSNLALWNMSPGGWYYGSTTIQANTWYNAVLVCSYDGTKYQMYLNGVAEGGTHTSYTWNSDYSGLKVGYIGRGDSSNGRYFYGAYPDFKIYRKELTAAEVLQNFNATRKTYGI